MTAFTFKTKPRGIHANFSSDCWKCGDEITVTNGRPERHDCREPLTLADLDAALDNRNN